MNLSAGTQRRTPNGPRDALLSRLVHGLPSGQHSRTLRNGSLARGVVAIHGSFKVRLEKAVHQARAIHGSEGLRARAITGFCCSARPE
jgi:hypothetical protein